MKPLSQADSTLDKSEPASLQHHRGVIGTKSRSDLNKDILMSESDREARVKIDTTSSPRSDESETMPSPSQKSGSTNIVYTCAEEGRSGRHSPVRKQSSPDNARKSL